TQTLNIQPTDHPVRIGTAWGTGFYMHWNGTIDEVMIWDRALSAQEINASYNANIWNLENNYDNLEPGTYTYKAYVVDQAGNLNNTEQRTFIVNSEPTVTSAILNSTYGTNLTTENLTVYTTYNDNDSDAITLVYDFRKNGISDAVLNMPFDVNGSNENRTNVKDYSTFGNNGSLYGAIWNASCNAFSGSGGCYEFDGINDYIAIPNGQEFNFTNNITLSAWIKFNDSVTEINRIVGKTSDVYSLATYQGKIIFYLNTNDCYVISNTIYTNNQWHYVVGIFDTTNNATLYIDGQQPAMSKVNINCTNTHANDNPFYISYLTSGSFNGSIDQVQIWNRSLSTSEISMLYNYGYNRTHSDATNSGESWKVVVTPVDQYEEGTPGTSNTVTINTPPPKVTLAEPINGNITMTNRSVKFRWLPVTDADGNTVTYNLSIKCYSSLGGSCSPSDDRGYAGITGTSYNLTETNELRYLRDDNYYYNWTVTAYDTYQYGEISNQSNFSLISEVIITMSVDGVDFGNMGNNQQKNTTTRSPAPLEIQNLGNVLTDINLSSATELFQTGSFPGSNFQYRINTTPGYTAAFNVAGTQTSWTNVPIVNETIISSLNYSTGSDKADIDIHVLVPINEPSGDKSSILTFIGWYA
ncbi:MAG: LamG domain-containing protein, partial [Nanoarchaeota archaeon]|nr:LamG domain-containing protein [Nanoarchaeota archaeon]